MENNGKKLRTVPLVAGLAFIAIAAFCIFMFCRDKFDRVESGNAYVFDGWVYGREDQKKANAALIAAGLDAFSWESGKLLVPNERKKEYQLALTNAGAFPKAPSESRGDALSKMSPFESDAKAKLRELDGSALQLEHTIEQLRGVEYATVGVHSRREQVGLTAKNIVTASIGVAYAEGYSLDSNAVFAITAAAKRQLGIDSDENVAILDLKEGTSYLGAEKGSGAGSGDAALEAERERVEKYWREKYLNAFADVKNIRVTVSADLVAVSSLHANQEESIDKTATRLGYDESEFAGNLYRRSVRGRVSPVTQASAEEYSERRSQIVAGATLGNPVNRNSVDRRVARVQDERLQRPRVLSDAAGLEAERASELTAVGRDEFNDNSPRLVEAAMQKKRIVRGNDVEIPDKRKNATNNIRQASGVERARLAESTATDSTSYELRSISFHFSIPRSYIWKAARQAVALSFSKETFAGADKEKEELFVSVQEQLLEETKAHAVSVFRPTAMRMGWNEETLERSFWFDVYSDPAGFDKDDVIALGVETCTNSGFGAGDNEERDVTEEENENLDENWEPAIKEIPYAGAGVLAASAGKVAEEYEPFEESGKNAQTVEDAEVVEQTLEPGNDSTKDWKKFLSADLWLRRNVMNDAIFVLAGILVLIAIFKIAAPKRSKTTKEFVVTNTKSYDRYEEKKEQTVARHDRAMDVRGSYASELNDEFDDDLDREIQEIATSKSRGVHQDGDIDYEGRANDEFSTRQKQVLELISRYPDRAAASLEGWVKGSEF